MASMEEIEKLVSDNGCPETLFVSDDDFLEVYRLYRKINRDDAGPFVLVLETAVRSKTESPKEVDLSDKPIFGASNAKI